VSQQDDALLAVFANTRLTVPVQYGAQSTRGVFTRTDESLGTHEGEDVVGTLITCEIVTGALTGIALNAAITVDGANYTIQDPRRIEDGKITRLYLAPAVTAAGP
jgi:hypothetical protein